MFSFQLDSLSLISSHTLQSTMFCLKQKAKYYCKDLRSSRHLWITYCKWFLMRLWAISLQVLLGTIFIFGSQVTIQFTSLLLSTTVIWTKHLLDNKQRINTDGINASIQQRMWNNGCRLWSWKIKLINKRLGRTMQFNTDESFTAISCKNYTISSQQ